LIGSLCRTLQSSYQLLRRLSFSLPPRANPASAARSLQKHGVNTFVPSPPRGRPSRSRHVSMLLNEAHAPEMRLYKIDRLAQRQRFVSPPRLASIA
jgi:hypothetical protein